MSYLKFYVGASLCLGYSFSFAQNATHQNQYTLPSAPFIQREDVTLKNDAPPIIYKDKPTVLVWIDGEPIITVDQSLRMYRILNTPHLIIKNHNDNKYYLYSEQGWYTSDSATTGYTYRKTLPPVIHLMDSLVKKGKPKIIKRNTPLPQVVVIDQPTALISTKGKPVWVNIKGTALDFAENSTDHLFRDSVSNKLYVLLGGRWYISDNGFEGTWKYCTGDQLPADFKAIEPGSPKAGILAHVPGTEAANNALTKAQEFKTRRITRGIDSTVAITFDGGPEFASVFGTELFVAQNSNIPVASYKDTYYVLFKGVWYKSKFLSGPWEVSTQLPTDINKLESDHPFYYSRFVHISDTTDSYVEVGHTGGYNHTYIQNNTIVYGTGYKYKQWHRESFLPRPITWLQTLGYDSNKGWFVQPPLSFYRFVLP